MLEKNLSDYGCDVKGAIQRLLGRKDLYLSLVKSFLADDSYSTALKAKNDNDSEGYFHAVHTLKGVSGNLGFTKLYGVASEICVDCRANQFAEAFKKWNILSQSYEEICSIIRDSES